MITKCTLFIQVGDWWERFIYLRSRASLMLNSNYYAVVSIFLSKYNTYITTATLA